MKTLQFEAVKVALKQDKTGYILTLNMHPEEVPEELLRDFVGARYQVVMVRLNDENRPMNRDQEYGRDPVRTAGILCRDKMFAEYLFQTGAIFEMDEQSVIGWLKSELDIQSRAELKENREAARRLYAIQEDFNLWKTSV
jgi:hypothetical protein